MGEITEQKVQSEGDFSAVLGNILGDPDMMSTIKSLAEKLKNDQSPAESVQAKEANSEPASANPTEAISALAPLLSADFSKLSRGDDKRACLLRALKPYLSENRCQAIEYIIKFSALSGILKNLS